MVEKNQNGKWTKIKSEQHGGAGEEIKV